MAVVYYMGSDGSVTARSVSGLEQLVSGSASLVPEGSIELTREEYEAELAALEAARQRRLAAVEQEQQERARTAYEELLGVGVSGETAARLSGYMPAEAEAG